ncbi:hypothetical protein [Bacillus sp. NEB1478]|uniref:hypothetical protein n=1 Tax=Bacillus sp. NEB1478 TaxID=3073816 RepID=UPI00287305DB|nr:hypothetical protein [Bacillus sp. NEB1478]WNB93428.1 hypothetical protein RGB74_07090 [Bacillus sp. NEB1478]
MQDLSKVMSVNDLVVKYNKTNLIPIINPQIGANEGIRAMLMYRINSKLQEIDSSPIVKAAYWFCFKDIPCYADTTLNALNPLKTFCIFRLIKLRKNKNGESIYPLTFDKEKDEWTLRNNLLQLILDNLDEIFDGYGELKDKFDSFSNLMYCFANLIPVPKGYNGINQQKGDYKDNNDYPYFYYQSLKKREDPMLNWVDEHLEDYHITGLYNLEPPFKKPDHRFEDGDLDNLTLYIERAISAIEERADWLTEKYTKK